MTSNIPQKIIWGFICIFSLLILILGIMFFSLKEYFESITEIDDTQETIAQIDAIDDELKDALIGTRGYVLTGDSEFLNWYYFALNHIKKDLELLRRLTKNNAYQQKNLDVLEPLINDKMTRLQNVIQSYKTGHASTSRILLKEEASRDLENLAKIRRIITDQMIAEELRVLRTWADRASTQSAQTMGLLAILSVFILITMIWTYYLFKSEINGRIKAENEVKKINTQLEEEFSATLEQAAIGIAQMQTSQLKMIRVNQYLASMLGYTKEELTETSPALIFKVEDREMLKSVSDKILTNVLPKFSTEIEMIRKNGHSLWANLTVSIIRDFEGKAQSFVLFFEDISENKEIKNQLESALQQAQVVDQKKTEFVSLMTHELKTPLNAIIGYSQLLISRGDGLSQEKKKLYLDHIYTSSSHLLGIIDTLLDISSASLELSLKPVDLAELVTDLTREYQGRMEEKQLNYYLNRPPEPMIVFGDAVRLRQIYDNLISNAIKFNRSGGDIRISLAPSPDKSMIISQIQDFGIGINHEHLADIFKPFSSIDTSYSRKESGVGLGLCLVKILVELHRGTITVESHEGIGTTFTVTLPANRS